MLWPNIIIIIIINIIIFTIFICCTAPRKPALKPASKDTDSKKEAVDKNCAQKSKKRSQDRSNIILTFSSIENKLNFWTGKCLEVLPVNLDTDGVYSKLLYSVKTLYSMKTQYIIIVINP